MNVDPLEQLRVELSVEPSPEFAAKVRARIAREPGRRWAPIIVWSVAAAAAMIVLGVVTERPAREDAASIAVAPTAAAAAAEARPATPAAPVAPRPSAAHNAMAVVARRDAEVRRERPATFEVLVPDDQRQAIDGLIRGLRDGRLDPAALSFASADLQAELVPPAAITVAPIEIPAIGGIDIKK